MKRFRNLLTSAAARAIAAAALGSFATFFGTVTLGGLVALNDGDWLPGSALSFTVAAAMTTLLTCAALATAPIWRRAPKTDPSLRTLPSAAGAPGRHRAAGSLLTEQDHSHG